MSFNSGDCVEILNLINFDGTAVCGVVIEVQENPSSLFGISYAVDVNGEIIMAHENYLRLIKD